MTATATAPPPTRSPARTPASWEATNVRLWRAIRDRTLGPETLIVGPAGTGKTFGILDVLHCLARDNRDLRILLGRATRTALTESVLVTYEQEVLPLDGMEGIAAGVTRRVRQSYRYPSGSEIVLGGLDNPSRVLSTAWDIAYINECIEASQDAWETLLSRMNRPGRSRRLGYLIGDTNPGDPSHWLRKRVDEMGTLEEWTVPHQANPAMFNGREWTEAGLAYLSALGRLTGTRRKRLLGGIWAAGEGAWFETFGEGHIGEWAEYDRAYPVHLAVDCGVHTGAVWFQVRPSDDGPKVTVFGDYYAYTAGIGAHEAATQIKARGVALCGGRFDRGSVDPADKAATGVGPTVRGEYQRAGLNLTPWPSYPNSVTDGLALLESFVATDPPGLIVHPRCRHLIEAFANYKRAKRGGQYIDRPEDPQHPYEDLMDALRGGLMDKFPDGRRPAPALRTVSARGGRFR